VLHQRVRWRSLGGQTEGVGEDFGGAWGARGEDVRGGRVPRVEIFDKAKALALAQNIKNFIRSVTSM